MPERPQNPEQFQTWANNISARLRAVERRLLRGEEGLEPLQTYEDGELLGDTLHLDFGLGVTAVLTEDKYVEVTASPAARTGYMQLLTTDPVVSIPTGGASFTKVPMVRDASPDSATGTFELSGGDLKVLRTGHYIGTIAARFNPSVTSATLFQFEWASFKNGGGHFVHELWQPRQRIESFAFVNDHLEVGDLISCMVYQASGVSIDVDLASILLSGPY